MKPEHEERTLSTADMVQAGERGREGETEQPIEQQTSAEQGEQAMVPLLNEMEEHDLQSRWDEIQVRFVDDPQKSVEQADTLVAEVMKRVAQVFADEREKLESQWHAGENISTEDLRVALTRYRSFFNRLLSYTGRGSLH